MSDRQRDKITRLNAAISELQRKLEESQRPWVASIPIEWVEAYSAVWHQAHHGRTSPSDAGYVSSGHAASRAPKYDENAMRVLRQAQAAMRLHASEMLRGLERDVSQRNQEVRRRERSDAA